MLYPALKDTGGVLRQLDGVTAVVASTVGPAGSAIASSLYGTVQSDGKMYYYTDIKGSKPIKDPRIGSHFGGQRYKTTSLQLLEQETATHGKNVYSIDGREWCRFAGHTAYVGNDGYGNYVSTSATTSTDEFIEIVCFANGLNYLTDTWTQQRDFTWAINGGSPTTNDDFETAVATPLASRYVAAFSVVNAFNGQTLGINTIRLNKVASHYLNIGAFELIAQDTTSTATRNQIQIQPQNVVSYGKRFAIDDTGLHYNPFAFKTDGSTAWASAAHNGTSWPVGTGSSHNIDTATSLGLDKWLHSSNYYKPYNGGRVVIWVDSAGAIKTSVNVMPPNARSIKNATITPKANASVANNTYLPTFEAGSATAYEASSLSEVAKTFNWREFGNGAANQGNNTSGTLQDASMLNAADDIAYVMDDGLTSLSGQNVASAAPASPPGIRPSAPSKSIYITFIGSGIGGVRYRDNSAVEDRQIWAQNLPYGTHILKLERDGNNYQRITVDGVLLETNSTTSLYLVFGEQSIYQPKMPPIPEDAVVIADYMLMADHVQQTDCEPTQISKGVRYCSSTRDHFHDSVALAYSLGINTNSQYGLHVPAGSGTNHMTSKLPFFGTLVQACVEASNHISGSGSAGHHMLMNGSATTEIALDSSVSDRDDQIVLTVASDTATLGLNTITTQTRGGALQFCGHHVVSPIHTSSHYQTFETPFLHELVGGDRNMEQTNLVVTPDGKTWDEVTRDTSYIGNLVLVTTGAAKNTTFAAALIFDEWRGDYASSTNIGLTMRNKDFAIAYDRFICLRDGDYEIQTNTNSSGIATGSHGTIFKNLIATNYASEANPGNTTNEALMLKSGISLHLIRGDYISVRGRWGSSVHSNVTIKRIG